MPSCLFGCHCARLSTCLCVQVALSILKLFQDFAPSTFLELSDNDTEQEKDGVTDDQEQLLLMTISGDTVHL